MYAGRRSVSVATKLPVVKSNRLLSATLLNLRSEVICERFKMPSNRPMKINPAKNPELASFFIDDDPDSIFVDQREIGHGAFGAVYYVSSTLICVNVHI